MLQCCLDESGVDGNRSPVATMAGLSREYDRFTWLDLDWQKALAKHGVCSVLHMTDFGKTGRLADIPEQTRRPLFTDPVNVINEHKRYSVAATLSTEQYKKFFAASARKTGLISIYSTCFLLLATLQGKQADHDRYLPNIPYLLDDGNERKGEVMLTHQFLVDHFQPAYPAHVGPLSFVTTRQLVRCKLRMLWRGQFAASVWGFRLSEDWSQSKKFFREFIWNNDMKRSGWLKSLTA
jgi:hypothetical protein